MQPGTDVLAPWAGEPNLYPAVVVGLDGAQAFVVFWEGDSAMVPASELRAPRYEPGQRVGANYMNQNAYHPGTIVQRLGGAVQVQLDNGQTIWTTWAKCRVPRG